MVDGCHGLAGFGFATLLRSRSPARAFAFVLIWLSAQSDPCVVWACFGNFAGKTQVTRPSRELLCSCARPADQLVHVS
ncbi:hypothetical protein K438DRAFT_1815601, partial [Mycena galopus ATCC 62051]